MTIEEKKKIEQQLKLKEKQEKATQKQQYEFNEKQEVK